MKPIFTLMVVLALAACGSPETTSTVPDETTTTTPPPTATTAPTTTTASITAGQRNAIRSAESYLSFAAFSRSGLIDQLEYEQYSTADASFAVDSLRVDWNEQAALSAKNYLSFSSFSRGGLIDQLKYEGFTAEQAAYGATAAGL